MQDGVRLETGKGKAIQGAPGLFFLRLSGRGRIGGRQAVYLPGIQSRPMRLAARLKPVSNGEGSFFQQPLARRIDQRIKRDQSDLAVRNDDQPGRYRSP